MSYVRDGKGLLFYFPFNMYLLLLVRASFSMSLCVDTLVYVIQFASKLHLQGRC